jgi:soluble lytic murein transglycosylase
LLERPEPSIDRIIRDPAAAKRLEDGALLAGWTRLTRDDPEAAQERYEGVASLVGPAHSGDYARALGLGLAWSRRAEDALSSFAAVPANGLDDLALQWQARAAMWAQDWKQVERSIGAMSAAQRDQARWRYWSARAAAQLGDRERAAQLYASILPTDNYYAASAAARLGRRAEPHPETLPADDVTIAALAAQDPFVRTRELLLAGLRGPAVTEWLHALAALDDVQRAQAVHLASRWHWHDVSVATATQQKVFFDYALLYPQPYDREVDAAARLTNVDPTLIYGVIRQESLFRTDAISSAGAVGLAQLIPDTARKVAREWQQPIPAVAELLDPGVNITLGAAHLRELMDRFDQQTAVALAGYNAGEFAAERWLPAEPVEADVWIENIPYNETRDYVQRVLWHSIVFAWLEKGAASDVGAWLVNVVPRTATAHAEPGS